MEGVVDVDVSSQGGSEVVVVSSQGGSEDMVVGVGVGVGETVKGPILTPVSSHGGSEDVVVVVGSSQIVVDTSFLSTSSSSVVVSISETVVGSSQCVVEVVVETLKGSIMASVSSHGGSSVVVLSTSGID
jgi:hypothetical protein